MVKHRPFPTTTPKPIVISKSWVPIDGELCVVYVSVCVMCVFADVCAGVC